MSIGLDRRLVGSWSGNTHGHCYDRFSFPTLNLPQDDKLRDAVKRIGSKNWRQISAELGNRTEVMTTIDCVRHQPCDMAHHHPFCLGSSNACIAGPRC